MDQMILSWRVCSYNSNHITQNTTIVSSVPLNGLNSIYTENNRFSFGMVGTTLYWDIQGLHNIDKLRS